MLRIALAIFVFGALLFPAQRVRAEIKPLELKDGDRIAWIGGAFVERDQLYGYLETLITAANPDKNLTFRNLGWSGDTVDGVARAVFGSPQDGFQRLLKDLKEAKPTLILVCYGANEAHGGEAGLAAFKKQYEKLLDEATKATGARVALVTPHRHEFVSERLPNPDVYNQKLLAYVSTIRSIADRRGTALVDLSDLVSASATQPRANARAGDYDTDNGVHFTPYGYWRVAPKIAERLASGVKGVDVVIDTESKSHQATHAKLSDVSIGKDVVRFTVESEQLPRGNSPFSEQTARTPALRLTIKGLDKNRVWKVTCDGKPVELGGDAAFEHGAALSSRELVAQSEELRQVINKKNELWFHRHRPQNETYLFLFRKHEQGNNAVEIPQFDPLIEAEEKKIAELKKPRPHVIEVKAE